MFEIASTEQETGEHATREIHTVEDNAQEFHDKETTVENLNEYQVHLNMKKKSVLKYMLTILVFSNCETLFFHLGVI